MEKGCEVPEQQADEQRIDGLMRWRCIGPVRGGRVVAVAGSYEDPNTFYFGAAAGGVWKTTNGGTYWRPVSDGYFTTASVGALAVAPSDSNVIYAGTGETTIRIDVSHGDGVYKSVDAGLSWRNVGLRETRHIGKVRVHPRNPDVAWVAALGHAFGPNPERGVFKTTDGGETWRQVLFVSEKAGAVDLSVDETNPRILYATIWEAFRSPWMISSGGPDSGLWRSVDGGETWTELTHKPGLPTGTLGKLGVAASPARAGRVWTLLEHREEGGLYRSDDHGEHWEKVCDNQHLISRAWYYIHLTADPQDADTVWVNNLDFWKSTDGGRTFAEYATPHGDNHDLWIDPRNPKRLIQGNDGGACVSFDGAVTFSTIYNQPTAQFYHLGIDSKEPYHVYGTQQDNTSIGLPSRVNHAAITWQDSFIAGTGESGYITPKPDDPEILYVGAIGSSPGGGNALQRYDRRTDQIRLVTSWPESFRGVGASDWKERFNWTYPIIFSPHDAGTLYIGGDRVLRSTDEGQTWEPISGDLTRADPETLKPTGGPVNLDAIGAETYATVYAFVESPHQAGVFWAGSDDGLVHLSRDSGATWTNVTPPDLPDWTTIAGLEVSPFDPATVYLAGTRYKLDDYQPYLYVTRDFGEHWGRIDAGIPRRDFTRVIRCDPTRQGLLYAGTETGVYVSFNDGASWQPFQLNLPVAPVYELLVKGSDLVAGTHGRSIWILDDLTPIRRLAAGLPSGQPFLFPPRPTERWLPGIDWSGNVKSSTNYLNARGGAYTVTTTADGESVRTYLDVGENVPRGAIITYRLTADVDPESPLTLTFRKADGTEVRSFTSRQQDDPAIARERRAPAKAGWNRFVWDLTYAPATRLEGTDPAAETPIPGPIVAPGAFTVTLKVGDRELTEPFEIVKPANRPATNEDLMAQEALLLRIHQQTDRTVRVINRMRDVRAQLDGWRKRTKERAGAGAITEAAERLRDQVLAVEQALLMPDLRAGWADEINAGTRLLAKLVELAPVVALGDYPPTASAEAFFTDVSERIEREITRFEALLDQELPKFNAQVRQADLGAVIVG